MTHKKQNKYLNNVNKTRLNTELDFLAIKASMGLSSDTCLERMILRMILTP